MIRTKTKNILIILLMLILSVSMTACGGSGDGDNKPSSPPDEPVNEGPDCVMLRQAMIETTDMAAVAFLGYYEGDYEGLDDYLDEYKFAEDHPFIKEIDADHFIEHEGDELYCIVPADEEAFVNVYEWIISEDNDFMGEVGNVIYEGDAEPFFIKCNMSDIMPNTFVEVVDSAGNTLEYIPQMSLMSGTLLKPYEVPTILDFTPYESFTEYFGFGYGFSLDNLTAVGNWITKVYTLNDDFVEGNWYFGEDGTVEFCHSVSEGKPYEIYYEGQYYEAEGNDEFPENTYIMDMKLEEDNSELQLARPEIVTAVTFIEYPDDVNVFMYYQGGDYIFDNAVNHNEYVLEPTMG